MLSVTYFLVLLTAFLKNEFLMTTVDHIRYETLA